MDLRTSSAVLGTLWLMGCAEAGSEQGMRPFVVASPAEVPEERTNITSEPDPVAPAPGAGSQPADPRDNTPSLGEATPLDPDAAAAIDSTPSVGDGGAPTFDWDAGADASWEQGELTGRIASGCCSGPGCGDGSAPSCHDASGHTYFTQLIDSASSEDFALCCPAGERCGGTDTRCRHGERCVFNATRVSMNLAGFRCEAGSVCDVMNREASVSGLHCEGGAVCRFVNRDGGLSDMTCGAGAVCTFQCRGKNCQNVTVESGALALFDCSGGYCNNLRCHDGATCIADCSSGNLDGCTTCDQGAACTCYGGPCNLSVCANPPCASGGGDAYLASCWSL